MTHTTLAAVQRREIERRFAELNARPHRAEPGTWVHVRDDEFTRKLDCKYCGTPVQRQGLFRRWYHVSIRPPA